MNEKQEENNKPLLFYNIMFLESFLTATYQSPFWQI